jgi:membrane protein
VGPIVKAWRNSIRDSLVAGWIASHILLPLQEFGQFSRYVIRNYFADGCRDQAGSLTYLSLFAVVPMLTLIYSMLSLIPSFQALNTQIQDLIFEYFLPTAGEELKASLGQFSRQARNLTALGALFLAGTAYMLLRNIEQTFNTIWRTRKHRSGVTSFLLYWAILTLGPLLIGLGFMITTYLVSIAVFVEEADSTGISRELLSVAPMLLEAATFTLLFIAVPNTRVPIQHAALGGVVTAIAFEIAKLSFTTIMSQTSFALIYGAFAAIPLFLLWIYVGWLIVLAGAEIVCALGSYQSHRARSHHPLVLSVGLLALLDDRHQRGLTVSDRDILATRWLLGQQKLSPRQWQVLRNDLIAGGLIRITEDNHYILGKNLAHFSLWELAGTITDAWRPLEQNKRAVKKTAISHNQPAWYRNTRTLLTEVDNNIYTTMNVQIAELIDGDSPA